MKEPTPTEIEDAITTPYEECYRRLDPFEFIRAGDLLHMTTDEMPFMAKYSTDADYSIGRRAKELIASGMFVYRPIKPKGVL